MKRLRLLTLVSLTLSVTIFIIKQNNYPTTRKQGDGLVLKKEWLAINKNPKTPSEDCRPADQTFLTFPEWFLVFSPEEQAHYFKNHTASSFPFQKHTEQLWESYKIVNDQIKENFPTNTGYHFMIWVIATSTTIEYTAKAWYEKIIGRITDTRQVITDEDRFNATFTQDYVDFIKDRPWYEFDFKSRLKTLWSSTSLMGSHQLRKIERRYILTSELLVKYLYGKLIGLGTKTVYEEALPTTAAVVKNLPTGSLPIIKQFSDSSALIYLPRYDKFNAAAVALANKNVEFSEIAGNNSAVLLTVLVSTDAKTDFTDAKTIFVQPISSELSMKRVAIAVPVPNLSTLLLDLEKKNITIEHIFDF
jgi:hypothetical protein